jgi:hypothetical protein
VARLQTVAACVPRRFFAVRVLREIHLRNEGKFSAMTEFGGNPPSTLMVILTQQKNRHGVSTAAVSCFAQ